MTNILFDTGTKIEIQNLTRSFPIKVVVDNIKIDVDVFPKFYNQNGVIVGISKEDEEGKKNIYLFIYHATSDTIKFY
jgi:hypothetical protein